MPVAVEAPTARVSVELPPVVTEVGLSVAVVSAGAPLAARLIVSAVPVTRLVEMVEVPLAPCCTERLAGFELIAKSFGAAVTVSETVVVCVALVPVPVTVIV